MGVGPPGVQLSMLGNFKVFWIGFSFHSFCFPQFYIDFIKNDFKIIFLSFFFRNIVHCKRPCLCLIGDAIQIFVDWQTGRQGQANVIKKTK